MTELNSVVEGEVVAYRLTRGGARFVARVATLFGLTSAVIGCGHYGVDLDGVVDASVDAGGNTEDDETTKPVKPKPTDATPSDLAATSTTDETSGESKPAKTEHPHDAGETSEGTIGPVDTHGTAADSASDASSADAEAPKDASVDGSVLEDAGSELDASLGTSHEDTRDDGTTSPGTTGLMLDAGMPTCGPSCSCAEGIDCNLVCVDESQCLANCETNALCDVIVGVVPTVKIDCAGGALCSALDMVADVVDVTCLGDGDCHAECGGEQSCAVECKGPGRCVTKCHDDAECNVTCKEGADCYVVYDNVDNVTLECEVGAVNHCDGLVTCDLPCP